MRFRPCKMAEFPNGRINPLIPIMKNVSVLRVFLLGIFPEVMVDSVDCLERHYEYVGVVPLHQKLGGLKALCVQSVDLR